MSQVIKLVVLNDRKGSEHHAQVHAVRKNAAAVLLQLANDDKSRILLRSESISSSPHWQDMLPGGFASGRQTTVLFNCHFFAGA